MAFTRKELENKVSYPRCKAAIEALGLEDKDTYEDYEAHKIVGTCTIAQEKGITIAKSVEDYLNEINAYQIPVPTTGKGKKKSNAISNAKATDANQLSEIVKANAQIAQGALERTGIKKGKADLAVINASYQATMLKGMSQSFLSNAQMLEENVTQAFVSPTDTLDQNLELMSLEDSTEMGEGGDLFKTLLQSS